METFKLSTFLVLFKIPLRLWKNVLLSFVLIGGEEGVLHVFKQKNSTCLVRTGF